MNGPSASQQADWLDNVAEAADIAVAREHRAHIEITTAAHRQHVVWNSLNFYRAASVSESIVRRMRCEGENGSFLFLFLLCRSSQPIVDISGGAIILPHWQNRIEPALRIRFN